MFHYIPINTAYLSIKNDDGVCDFFLPLRAQSKG